MCPSPSYKVNVLSKLFFQKAHKILIASALLILIHSDAASMLGPSARLTIRGITRTTLNMARKAGVAEPSEIQSFVQKAGEKLLVIDVRNPDANQEPGDQTSLAVAGLPSDAFRPRATHLIYNRTTDSMPLPDVPLDTPIITHCGGGGRGQKAKEYLEKNGFTTVINGGGPKETECWAEFGDK
jgi:rhodanese-related sulfurtransferase